MPLKGALLMNIIKNRFFPLNRTFTSAKIIYNKPPESAAASSEAPIEDVPGLSDAVLKVPNEPVGPGASKSSSDYKNPEYFSYDKHSYFEAEIEMLKYRLPQPDANTNND